MEALLLDFPESFESDRLTIRAPRPGDGTKIHAAFAKPLMISSYGCRGRSRCLLWRNQRAISAGHSVNFWRGDLGYFFFLKVQTRWSGAAACIG